MISKDKLRETLLNIRELNGTITLYYVPLNTINSVKDVYGLYYSGRRKIEIGKYLSTGIEYIEITDKNSDEIVDKVYALITDDIGDFIMKALTIMKLDDVDLKYFDREPELFKTFQETVLKLKNNL